MGVGRPRLARGLTFVGLREVALGATYAQAAKVAGVGLNTLRRRAPEEGVVVLRPRVHRRGGLTLEDREEIRVGIVQGDTDALIARRLGRHRGTIGREIRNNGGRDGYRAFRAEHRAGCVAQRPKQGWTLQRPWLWVEVQELIRTKVWSPEQIACRLRKEHPDQPEWWVSHEAIYQAVFVRGCPLDCVSDRGGWSSQVSGSRPGKKSSIWLRASRQCQVELDVLPKRLPLLRLRTPR